MSDDRRSKALRRVQLLLGQSRFDLAERELRAALAAAPLDARAHGLLGFCLVRLDRVAEALAEAREAVQLAPARPFGHYVMGAALLANHEPAAAERAAREAVRLDPEDADTLVLLARTRLAQRDWRGAVEHAERALALDPERVNAVNVRAMALTQLGESDQAANAIEGALARDPDNPLTHRNFGWNKLNAGDHRGAQRHFRESLRLDPNSELAQKGMVTALKARNPVYRAVLRYFLWAGRLDRRAYLLAVVGGATAAKLLASVARAVPATRVVVLPLLLAYAGLVLVSWAAAPLSRLVLRLRRGRLTPS